MPWAVAAAGVGLVGNLVTSSKQKGAAQDAQSSANAATTAARDQARADLQPWRGTGENALTMTGDLSGANGPEAATKALANYQTSPGYQWQLSEGLRGVDAGAAAKGMVRSGATLKAEQAYGAGLANQDFAAYYNRLNGLSTVGENAAAGQGTASQSAANSTAQTDLGTGANLGSIYGNQNKGISDALGGALGNKGVQNTLTSLWNGGGSTQPANMWEQS